MIVNTNNKYTDMNSTFYSDNNIVTSTSQEAINNSISNILFTSKGSKLGDPEFGINLDSVLFSQIDTITENIIYNDIYDAIKKYEPRININTIDIVGNPDNNVYNIGIVYTIINSPSTKYSYTQVLKRL